ncbi:MAG: hypothetical protein WBV28_01520, partial [Terracidiphilus sp.]
MNLDDLLKGSFPRPGDEEPIRALFDESLSSGDDALGVATRRQQNCTIQITYPVTISAWRCHLLVRN